jgi:hypothetical protein
MGRSLNPNTCSADEWLQYKGWAITPTGCWEAKVGRDPDGYGITKFHGRHRRIHRFAYETWVGPIPEGLSILHSCDNPPCINPEHLSPGTTRQNNEDRNRKGRTSKGVQHYASKLNEQEVLEIRAEAPYGVLTHRMLAEVYGVTDVLISYILSRKAWKHI